MNLKEENKHNAVARVFAPAEVRSRVWPVIGAAIVALLAGGYAAHSWFSGGIEKAVQVKTQLSTADNSGHPDPLTEALLLARDAQRKNDWGRVVSILEDAFAETGVETHPRRGEAEELLALARRRFADRQNAAEKIFEAENFIAAEKFSEARAALSAARVLWADVPRANEVEKLLNTGNKEVRFAQAETLRLQARAMQPNITPPGNWEQAVKLNREAAALFEAAGDSYWQGKCLHEMAYCLQPDNNRAGDWKVAFDSYKKAMELLSASNDKAGIALSLNQMGFCAMPGRFPGAAWPEASGYYQRALEIYSELGNKKGTSFSLHQLGWCSQLDNNPDGGNWDTAAGYFARAAVQRGEIGAMKGQALSLFQQAFSMLHGKKENHTPQSRELFQQSAQLRRAAGDENGAADAERWAQ